VIRPDTGAPVPERRRRTAITCHFGHRRPRGSTGSTADCPVCVARRAAAEQRWGRIDAALTEAVATREAAE
jgi:hypothetical protein